MQEKDLVTYLKANTGYTRIIEAIIKKYKSLGQLGGFIVLDKLSDEEVKQFHFKMWIFGHGIATLVANNTCKFTDEQIDSLLLTEYQALMTLESNKD